MSDHESGGRSVVRAMTSQGGLGGLLLFAFSAVVLVETTHLRIGTAGSMGPGYFPLVLGLLIAAFAVAMVVEGFRHPDERVSFGPARPFVLLMGAILLFAVSTPYVGGVVSITLMIAIVCLAEPGRNPLHVLLIAAGVVATVWLLFVLALRVQLPMLPVWWRA